MGERAEDFEIIEEARPRPAAAADGREEAATAAGAEGVDGKEEEDAIDVEGRKVRDAKDAMSGSGFSFNIERLEGDEWGSDIDASNEVVDAKGDPVGGNVNDTTELLR